MSPRKFDRPNQNPPGPEVLRQLLSPARRTTACRCEPRGCTVARQARRQLHASVAALAVLEHGDDRAPDRDRRAVQRVQRARALVLARADVQTPRLVVGGVRARGQLAIALLAGNPRLAVVLLGGRVAEIADGDVDDAVRQLELLEDLLLQREDPLVLDLGVLGGDEAEHLDLVELVYAEDATRVLACGPGLAPEARREAGVAQRQ